ncbi:unnamed protein product, partial [Rotaria sp. Silwood2]
MEHLLTTLRSRNSKVIETEFDYLFLFIYAYVVDRFSTNKVIYNIIDYSKKDDDYYKLEYNINGKDTTINITNNLVERKEIVTLHALQIVSEPIQLNDFVKRKKKHF